jgi:hypothetical protein
MIRRTMFMSTVVCAASMTAGVALSSAQAQPRPGYAPEIAQADAPYVVVEKTIPDSGKSWELHLVQTRDQIYVPMGIRKPEGDGPFPIILIGSGEGREGITKVERGMYLYEGLMDRLLERGYAAAFVNYRNEIPLLYNEIERPEFQFDDISGGSRALRSVPTLDTEDYIAIVEHAKALPFIDEDAVGSLGSSHSGEIILKGSTVIDFAAGVASEPAAHEYLVLDMASAPRDESGREVQLQDIELARGLADKARAMERIRQIDTPLLILGRDGDHLQGLFQLVHEWLVEAGREATWASFDHPVHGYSLLGRDESGVFDPDDIQERVFELYMAFFDKHLKSVDSEISRASPR